MRLAALALAGLAGLALAGCATGPMADAGAADSPAVDPTSVDARRAALDAFRVAGSLGYWTEEQNLVARLDWREVPGRTEVDLVAPLGLGRLALVEGPGGATLSRSGAPPATGPSGGALLQRELGLAAPVPLGAMRDWLRGLPGEGATDVRRDAAGRLETLLWADATGARWFARVRRWTEAGGLELPALVTARSGDRRLRLALSDWRPGPGDGVGTTAPGAPDGTAPAPDGPGRSGAGGRLGIPGR